MLRNYFKILIRQIKGQSLFSFLNLLGLTMGLFGFILIFLFVRYEVQYDKFHTKLDRIYQMVRDSHFGEDTFQFTPFPFGFRDIVINEYPEVEKATRVYPWNSFVFKYGDKLSEERVLMADKEIFEIFTFNIIQGNENELMNDRYSAVISQRMAEKMFPDDDALGKTFQISNLYEFTITGVYENLPSNSTIKSDIFLPFEFLGVLGSDMTSLGNNSCHMYLLLHEGTDVEAFDYKLAPRLGQVQIRDVPDEIFLHPFKDLHLYRFHYEPGGVIQSVYIFSAIGFLTLFLAGINYVNLVTARSVRRAKEIGIRKSLGANRFQVMIQFLGESVVFSFLALNFAILITELTLPVINPIVGKSLHIEYSNPGFVLTLLSFALVTGILAGAYPAFYLSGFSPVSVLKGVGKPSGIKIKSVLIIVQFSISIALIITSVLMYRQFNYMVNLPVGLNKDNVFFFQLEDETLKNLESMRTEFSKLNGVENVSFSSHLPIQIYSNSWGFEWEGKDPDNDVLISTMRLDENYQNTFEIPLHEGRFYNAGETVTDTTTKVMKVVINKKFKDIMKLESAVGYTFKNPNWDLSFEIIGVTEDFNFYNMKEEVAPLIMAYAPGASSYGFIRFNGDMLEARQSLEAKYRELFPEYPPNFQLMNDKYEAGFSTVNRSADIYGFFTLLAIIISCLGLYGLSNFMAEQRKKEMGIRKAMGASTSGLTFLMLKNVGMWMLIANAIAIPSAWYYSEDLLSKFVFRTDISVGVIVMAVVLSMLISGFTVLGQIFKTAKENPAQVLKYQ